MLLPFEEWEDWHRLNDMSIDTGSIKNYEKFFI